MFGTCVLRDIQEIVQNHLLWDETENEITPKSLLVLSRKMLVLFMQFISGKTK
jgi:hypothetical protein